MSDIPANQQASVSVRGSNAVPVDEPYETLLDELRTKTGFAPPFSLVSFTIAGVQQFLEAARTTRDVWNGSYLLSWLTFRACWQMLEEIASGAGVPVANVLPCVVIPDVSAQPLVHREMGMFDSSSNELAIASFPNSILLLVPGGRDNAAKVAANGKRALEAAWSEMAGSCRDAFAQHLDGPGNEFACREWSYQTRLDRVLEIYWSAVELPASEDGFDELCEGQGLWNDPSAPADPYRSLLEWSVRVLNSRKGLRNFEQIGEEGYRCSLCGGRSALADYDTKPRQRDDRPGRTVTIAWPRLRDYWQRVRENPGLRYRFRPEEQLCAVCVVRRLAPLHYFRRAVGIPNPDFPSTSTLSTAHAVACLLDRASRDSTVERHLARFAGRVRALRKKLDDKTTVPSLPLFRKYSAARLLDSIDGDWFYSETYDAKHLAGEYERTEADARQLLHEERLEAGAGATPIDELRDNLRKVDPAFDFQPSNYYALIAVDGDHMGDWIAGRRRAAPHPAGDEKTERPFSPTDQQAISAGLARFASKIRSSFESQIAGKVVYAGGDDLLAFVPREEALKAMRRVDEAFRGAAAVPQMKVSIACVLARHNDPLSMVIERVHKVLKGVAKDTYGRNAFAVYRTTGGRVTAGTRIRQQLDSARSFELLQLFERIHQHMLDRVQTRRCGLSGRIVSALDEVAEPLRNASHEAQVVLLRYLAARQFQADPALPKDERERKVIEFQDTVQTLYDGLCAWLNPDNVANRTDRPRLGDRQPMEVLVDLLSTARFLTREGR